VELEEALQGAFFVPLKTSNFHWMFLPTTPPPLCRRVWRALPCALA
jgi:hypothetical protein